MRGQTSVQADASESRASNNINGVQPNFRSSIPRVRSTIANARAANCQPSFDFIAGESPLTSSRGGVNGMRKSLTDTLISSSNIYKCHTSSFLGNNEEQEKYKREINDIRAENNALKYSLENLKQQQELASLRHEDELRDVTRRAEEDFKKKQLAEIERVKAERQLQNLLTEIAEIRESADQEKAALQIKLRQNREMMREWEEKIVGSETEQNSVVRDLERKVSGLDSMNQSLEKMKEDLKHECEKNAISLLDLQSKLSDKESENGKLEAEILRLRTHTNDDDTLNIIRRELSEQVSHIKKLELNNRELMSELKHFKQIHKSVEVVEEEKQSLQRKLDTKKNLEIQLNEAQIQHQRLQDERLAWTAYLQSQTGLNGDVEFDSPEMMARALVAERLNSATLVERLGSLNQELCNKEFIVKNMEKEKQNLVESLEMLKKNGAENLSRVQIHPERQKGLALKEIEYLRAQLKTYDSEDLTFKPDSIDEAKLKRISELEDLVEQYRKEVVTLNEELTLKESIVPEAPSIKRKFDDTEENDRQNHLMRKLRNLQNEFETLQNDKIMVEKDLSVARECLEAMSQKNKTRILALRSNPTSNYEAIKLKTLDTLQRENADLLSQLQGSLITPENCVPSSTLAAAKLEHTATQQALESEKKRNDRLMKVWGAKSTEFRQMIVSLLGWDIVFMRDGKTRITSCFYPSKEDAENSIVFDGEKGTMKISGGTESAFAIKISDQVRFWCKERGSIPCFLAALTLEFWEEMNAAEDRTRQE